MSKKLFVLLMVLMLLTTSLVVVLSLTGHEDMVRAAFAWLTQSVAEIVGALGGIGLVILVVVLLD